MNIIIHWILNAFQENNDAREVDNIYISRSCKLEMESEREQTYNWQARNINTTQSAYKLFLIKCNPSDK